MEESRIKWARVKRTFLVVLGVLLVASGALAYFLWGPAGAATTVLGALCLALGFWLTEMLIGIFTRVKTANATAMVLIFSGKLLWWGLLFWCARHLPNGLDGAVALGIGAFLLALLAAALAHYGMPRISDGKGPSSS